MMMYRCKSGDGRRGTVVDLAFLYGKVRKPVGRKPAGLLTYIWMLYIGLRRSGMNAS